MRKLLVLTAICLTVIVSASEAMAQSYVQNDRLTCGCDNPITPGDECFVPIGIPGAVCPTNAAHFVQNDQATCGCDNPTTGPDECSFIGIAGAVCPSNPAHFVQNDQITCGCDNPTTPADECAPPPSNCDAQCLAIHLDDFTPAYRTCVRDCMGCSASATPGIYTCTSCDSGGACCIDNTLNLVPCPGGGGGGCFAAATDIMMEDGTLKKIVDLKIGDRVMSFDKKVGAESGLVGNRVTHIFLMGEKDVYDLRGTLVTGTHKFLTGAGEMVAVQDLKAGDMLVLADGTQVPSGELKIVGHEPVYNFTVENAHSYVADGIRTGNMTIPSLPEGLYTEHDLILKNVIMNSQK
jgi:hypothetical protein